MATKELSDLVEEGKKFIFEELGLEEKDFGLIGRVIRMREDETVEHLEYYPQDNKDNDDPNILSIYFLKDMRVSDFELFLDKYEIPREFHESERYSHTAIIRSENIGVLFCPVVFRDD